MGVARQTPSAAAGGLMFELQAKGQEKSENTLDKHLAVIQQVKVSDFILEIDGNCAVFSSLFGLT